ncbi:retropepsin-like aspartic protease [Lentimicrobium sp.]|mgnify:CR=1 FL=1|jgi:predicted aspartyl protease|uniref:aspartyl protease family protein n=1 Tax=Lentimicrobium sp. TaxID=2034841 RepID=UPI0025CE0E9A|nr:retropepsin-like aspartic protease [Lentimicrobium sp.]MCO5255755.1 retropepsin-like domain-containing protein [Lentimicrobium sp.]MCO5263833.1 retropepsin-like domain-containing protein [Lentimicrobium sp.]HPF64637.1 retropepsin-like aspartic protease [Lentimicrobium sp.]HPJ62986.1 retropepsin-like aspartic protease [Lentimicrobium sp.]HPR25892.1 retropepsin-like aspartic protease [Lentimicrobium sp.]
MKKESLYFINLKTGGFTFLLTVAALLAAAAGNINPEKVKVNLLLKGSSVPESLSSVVIPLKQAGRLFLIEARIDDQEGNLIFDTGATGLVLNRTYFRKYAAYEKPGAGGITGNFSKVYGTIVKEIDASGFFYEKVPADMADLGHIEDKRGVKILGLFGMKMIDDMEVIFDAAANQLTLVQTDLEGNRTENNNDLPQFNFRQKIETHHKIMLVRGRIGDKTLNFCLDTGAEINALHRNVSKKVMETVQISRRAPVGGAASRSSEVLYGIMNELEVGSHQFGIMGTVIMDLTAMSEAYGCTIDGMLGYDFWIKGIYSINFRKEEIGFNVRKGDRQ